AEPAIREDVEWRRIDVSDEIIDEGVALNYDGAGIGIDLDLGDVAAVGKGLSWRYAVMRRVEPRLHARRQSRGIARRLRHRENIEAEIGGGPTEYPMSKTYVLRLNYQKV